MNRRLLPMFGIPLLCAAVVAQGRPVPVDLVLLNGTVITVDPGDTIAEAVAIARGGSCSSAQRRGATYVGQSTRVIDLAGRTATPGLIDTHVHFSEPADTLDLGDARSMDDVIAKVRARARQVPRRNMGARRRLGRREAQGAALHHRRGSRQGRAGASRLPHAHNGALRRRQLAGAEAVERHARDEGSARRHDRSRRETAIRPA